MTNRRQQVQIWLDPDRHQMLSEIAQQTDCSLSELLQRIIQGWLNTRAAKPGWQRRQDALNELSLIRIATEQHSGLIQENLLATVRQEREQELGHNLGELNALDT